jgi:hypothetical protein
MRRSEQSLLSTVRSRHGVVHVIVAPPRTGSTLVARILWQSPDIGYYSHEPFDATYHLGVDLASVARKLAQPLDVRGHGAGGSAARALLLKELTFQVGRRFEALTLLGSPILFVIRDPRLSIASRMEQRRRGGEEPTFPTVESGWADLAWQVEHCRSRTIPYAILDSFDLRSTPEPHIRAIAELYGQPFTPAMLAWEPVAQAEFGLALASQEHWNERVLASRGVEAPLERPPALEEFPRRGGMRAHVARALEVYRDLLVDEARLARKPTG